MATSEPDDRIAEELERQLQLAITAAVIAVQRAVAARREALLRAEQESQERARALRAEIAREQALAQVQIQAVFDEAWWEQATPQDAAAMWEQAAQWQENASAESARTFQEATERINSEVSERWGVDVAELVALAELQELDRTYDAAVNERERHGAQQQETPVALGEAEAAGARIAANAVGHHAAAPQTDVSQTAGTIARETQTTARPNAQFDSPERQGRLTEGLRQAGVPEDAVEARTLADIGQAHEPAEAVRRYPTLGGPSSPSVGRARPRPVQRHR